jgi:hypothetical protein
MLWRFYINGTEIDEPMGFADITFRITRDPNWHGIIFEATTSTLGFYGEAFTILKALKESDGVDAVADFIAEVKCDGQQDYQEGISGRLNFRSYDESCGDECIIRMNVEQEGCATLFTSRWDQKVDIDSAVSVGGEALTNYAALGFPMQLATQEIPISGEAYVVEAGDGTTLEPPGLLTPGDQILIRPVYGNVIDNSIMTGNLDQVANFFQDPDAFFFLTPQLLFEDIQACTFDDFQYNIRMKGTVTVSGTFGALGVDITLIVDRWNGVDPTRTTIHSDVIVSGASSGTPYAFDETYSSTLQLNEGEGLYAYILVEITGGVGVIPDMEIEYNFERATSWNISNTKSCPPTDVQAYMVNETLARAIESVTDKCLTFRSDYYGRTDSLPVMASEDGCGSLRVLMNGLKIRQAENKQFFASPKELMEGLRAIDAVGFDISDNVLRMEPIDWFYRDSEIMQIDSLPKVNTRLDESRIYSNIQGGYEKWEVRSIKGIDEFNSQKEYRTQVKAVSNALNIRAKFIASGYIIEDLRSTTLVNSGDKDSNYDNDIFIVQVKRGAYVDYEVEQGGLSAASGFFSPPTAYNWRIRPAYNLMRWFRWIGRSLQFSAGQGNYEAKGMISDDCSLESKPVGENSDIDATFFKGETDPILTTDLLIFDAPMSVAEYNAVKANKYGYISVQCGDGEFIPAYIRSIEFQPARGEATFNLLPKWP